MKYKNTNTGVVIDTPCIVSGGNWLLLDSKAVVEKGKDIEVGKQTNEVVEPTKEQSTTDFDGITRPQIMQELDAFGIEYDKRANKQTLYDLMMSQGK